MHWENTWNYRKEGADRNTTRYSDYYPSNIYHEHECKNKGIAAKVRYGNTADI